MAFLSNFKSTVLLWVLLFNACGNHRAPDKKNLGAVITGTEKKDTSIIVGANRTEIYLPILKRKKVGVIANQTSIIFKNTIDTKHKPDDTIDEPYTHLIDSLVSHGIDIKKVFAPEHGFRGDVDAGEAVADGLDTKTGLPLISLYGKNKKPSPEQLKGLDIIVFDIQDVGVRFYTYIATLQLAMEACAKAKIPMLVLDRPNPNGHYVDGPTMEKEHTGFLGMNTIPLVYGMTIGEYARMINEEGWLKEGIRVDLTVIKNKNYTHDTPYSLPVRPSPNLPNDVSINLYPSLGLFEGTQINAGRGTEHQFQRYGAPFLDSVKYGFRYRPHPNFGSKHPKHKGEICYGKDLSLLNTRMSNVSLEWLIDAYTHANDPSLVFVKEGFTKHAGTEKLQRQIEQGLSETEIKKTWQADL
ncbi:MAG: DUF1343 domain-containing protein, partial [Bacteroidota bacterium]